MDYEAKNFADLLGLTGFSNDLLKNHFMLYQGYVKNTNTLMMLLKEADPTTPQYAELKRRFGWEWNGMRLHELYFDNLAKELTSLQEENSLKKQIVQDFGSFKIWEKDFRALGAIRGIGWVILAYDPQSKKLFNTWINEHDVGHLAGAVPTLVMDVFEHAFLTDYGLKRPDYIAAFFEAIDWRCVTDRFDNSS